jgi:tetratricopeptide (TPR) repeat protein
MIDKELSLPNDPAALIKMSQNAIATGQLVLALDYAEKALSLSKKTAPYFQVAYCHAMLGKNKECKKFTIKGISCSPKNNASFLCNAGDLLSMARYEERALDFLLKSYKIAPQNTATLSSLSRCYLALGKLEQAEKIINQLIEVAPYDYTAYPYRSRLRKQTKEKNNIADLTNQVESVEKGSLLEENLNYALAKEYEDLEEWNSSFKCLKKASDLHRSRTNYNIEHDISLINDLIKYYDKDNCVAKGGYQNNTPIFVISLPRTGSTLAERILASHGSVSTAGELYTFSIWLNEALLKASQGKPISRQEKIKTSLKIDFHQLGEDYVNNTKLMIETSSKHIIDKEMTNFLYCGLINRALPKAKIIHITRNPMDTCYAIYKTLFGEGAPYSYDLDELAEYYIGYRRLMDHWHSVIPGKILDISYENLINDTEGQARKIIDFCGLKWEKQCLDFHKLKTASTTASAAQVRSPIYKSSLELWRNYEEELSPLRLKLKNAGLI